MCLLIVGAMLWGVSGSLGAGLALGGLILLGAAYLSYFRNGDSASTMPGGMEKRWRGQTVNDEPRGPSLWDRIRGRRRQD